MVVLYGFMVFDGIYPLVLCYIAIEHDHRNSFPIENGDFPKLCLSQGNLTNQNGNCFFPMPEIICRFYENIVINEVNTLLYL